MSGDRVIGENVFGRMGLLWTVMNSKWKWAERNYDSIGGIFIAITNFHINRNPLRQADYALKIRIGPFYSRLVLVNPKNADRPSPAIAKATSPYYRPIPGLI